MATHSCVLAWRIPGTGEPGGCRLGSQSRTRLKRLSSSSSSSSRLLSAKPVRIPSSLNTFSTGFGHSPSNQVLKETPHAYLVL